MAIATEGAFREVDRVVGKTLRLIDTRLRDLIRFLEIEKAQNTLDNVLWLKGYLDELRETYPYSD